MAEVDTHSVRAPPSQTERRRLRYLRALQSDRFTVLVGRRKEVFKVPEDLLAHCSPFFEKSMSLSFKEHAQRVIELPDDDPVIFQHFFVWVHCPQYDLSLDRNDDALINLGIFADRYHIRLLINQISNLLRKGLGEGCWRPNPDVTRAVYGGVAVNSIFRRLCSLGLVVSLRTRNQTEFSTWETAFTDFADLGWDYFRRMQKGQTSTYDVTSRGACRFHDHSDVPGWIRTEVRDCPYPEGAPVEIIEENTLSTSRSDSEMTDGKNGSESRTGCEDPFEAQEPEDALSEEVWP